MVFKWDYGADPVRDGAHKLMLGNKCIGFVRPAGELWEAHCALPGCAQIGSTFTRLYWSQQLAKGSLEVVAASCGK